MPGHLLNRAIAKSAFRKSYVQHRSRTILNAMMGPLGFAGDVASWPADLVTCYRSLIDLYKGFRHLLDEDFYQLLPMPMAPEQWDAVQFVSYSRAESVVFIFSGAIAGTKHIVLRGLRPGVTYRLQRITARPTETAESDLLMRDGVTAQLEEHDAELLILTMRRL
jgi:hypothetical protein